MNEIATVKAVKDRLTAIVEAVRIMWICWRLSQRTGIPFHAAFDAHVQVLDAHLSAMKAEAARLEAAQATERKGS